MNYARALNEALRAILADDPRVVLLGEDIIDPYGGAFKVTKGLSTLYPERVLTTPVSESAITGVANGLAMAGHRPIIEIMFGDFVTLCFDQVLNHMVKFPEMYGGQVTCPVILRTPMGAGRAYGPTHSQSLEKFFCGIPGLTVAAASAVHAPKAIFDYLLAGSAPVLFVENKRLYAEEMAAVASGRWGMFEVETVSTSGFLPTTYVRPVPRAECGATVVAYGYSATIAVRVAEKLAVENEVFIEVVVPAQIAPMAWSPLLDSVAVTGRLIVCEEGTDGWTWGAQLSAHVHAELFNRLRSPVRVLASAPAAIPSDREREAKAIFHDEQLVTALLDLL
jgi:acetoin:2,6-dichlorophenolindophenol oxidoreductase subunit beta